MALGILLHAALAYTDIPWAVRDPSGNHLYFHLFSFIHGFRLPLFFLLSGFFTAMLWQRRGTRGLLIHRGKRIGLPLLLGLLTIVPATFAAAIVAGVVTGGNSTPTQGTTNEADLWTAAATGDVPRVEHWILTEANLDAQDPVYGVTPLGWAAITGQPDTAAVLLEGGANPSAPYRDANTPLHSACFFGRDGVAGLLIDAGADLDAQSGTGERPADAMRHGQQTVSFIAGLLRIEVDFVTVQAGRDRIAEKLETVQLNEDEESKPPSSWRWLFDFPIFSHLWFLWHLCWLVVGFVIVAAFLRPVAGVLTRAPRWLVTTPACLLLLVPVAAALELAMDARDPMGPVLGPATSAGIIPMPLVLGYNAVFFGFGSLLYLALGRERVAGGARLGRGWWLLLPIGATVYLPTMMLLYGDDVIVRLVPDDSTREVLAALGQGVFVWTMAFGLIGLGERILSRERPWVRYASDSSYWLYLAHLPVVFVLQAGAYFLPMPAWAKFTLVVVITTVLLVVSYQLLVRHTLVGRMLNGPGAKGGLIPPRSRAASPAR